MNKPNTIPTSRPERPIYIFRVPQPLSDQIQITSFGIVELTASEEVLAAKKAASDAVKLSIELVKESLRLVNDEPTSTLDGTIDARWETMHPKARQLAINAYSKIHTVTMDEVGDFFTGMEVSTI